MGECRFCGRPAGIFRSRHAECARQFDQGLRDITNMVSNAIGASSPPDNLQDQIREIAATSFVSEDNCRKAVVKGWSSAVETCLADGVLSESEESCLVLLKDRFALSQDDLDKDGSFSRVAKSSILREVLNGSVPNKIKLAAPLPINLQKSEQVVWAFDDAEYLEDKTKRHYVGGSQGVSIRVMKGVYYRTGAFKGQAVERTERVHVDSGIVAITNKHIYFAGPRKSLRVPYSKVVSFQPFSDGIGLIRDASSAKPQIFVTGDGWFTYNLVTNLAQI